MALVGQNDSQREGILSDNFPCTPQGGKLSPACIIQKYTRVGYVCNCPGTSCKAICTEEFISSVASIEISPP